MNNLSSSAQKKRKVPEGGDDDIALTPKRARLSHTTPLKPNPFATIPSPSSQFEIPKGLLRLVSIQGVIEKVLVATSPRVKGSPHPVTGRIPAMIHHLSVRDGNLDIEMTTEDLQKLCWFWEWDGRTIPMKGSNNKPPEATPDDGGPSHDPILTTPAKEDNYNDPFLITHSREAPKEWVRGGSGFCISPTTHAMALDKIGTKKKVPLYGIGIVVDLSEEGVVRGHTAVARWFAAADERKHRLLQRLRMWMKLTSNSDEPKGAPIPLADIPPLSRPLRISNPSHLVTPCKLTLATAPLITPNSVPPPPSNNERIETPSKDSDGFLVPFPITAGDGTVTPHGPRSGQPSSELGGILNKPSSDRNRGIRTPSFGNAAAKLARPTLVGLTTPTPGSREGYSLVPKTPLKIPSSVASAVETPKRTSLKERIAAKSKREGVSSKGTATTAPMRFTDEDERRRQLEIHSRLHSVADAVFMLLSATRGSGGLLTSSSTKGRAAKKSDIVSAVTKSSNVSLSEAKANESLMKLCELCPFFLQQKDIGGEIWLEMPRSSGPSMATDTSLGSQSPSQSTATGGVTPGSPIYRPTGSEGMTGSSSAGQTTAGKRVKTSPKSGKKEGGIREVHERIREVLRSYEGVWF